MSDQAASLRELMAARPIPKITEENRIKKQTAKKQAKLIAVASGKGGVGKSNFTLNLALKIHAAGKKVLVFDADMGMANIDVLMGVSSKFSLYHVLTREKRISEIIQLGPMGLPYIAGGSGFVELLSLTEQDIDAFTTDLESLASEMDYIFFDTGAGLSLENRSFIAAADECIVVTTPEPTAITDAYALIKMMHKINGHSPFGIIVNRAENKREADQVSSKIQLVAKRFLGADIPLLGYVTEDSHVMRAVKKQTPFTTLYPNCTAAKDMERISLSYTEMGRTISSGGQGLRGFVAKWLRKTAQ
ncbi:MinD/ParA family protein [Paenibacillus shunpengii]|uniref:MinD/ParA family protein n=1 Tax=Paenibacillus shunpengii TaxID=2054424 RepID=A0ABW5SK26_9BACL|nr:MULTISPECIES: MinD/ParA family protein [unclassified Paenibacillus]OMC70994.1 cobyrinic acid a,c-diamide synthase [Paenibacillus sp. FSL H7-0326]SDW15893.1 flagellar biosynthesis protein FlhG [Paenibacillus sp. PDC88]